MSTNTHFKTQKRQLLTFIDRDPKRQAQSMAEAVYKNPNAKIAAHEIWGRRFKDFKADLLKLCKTELLRNNFPEDGIACIKKIQDIVEPAHQIVYSWRSDLSPALAFVSPRKSEVSCTQILEILDDIYRPGLSYLIENGYMSDEDRREMGMHSSLTEVVQENRLMYQFVSSIESYAKAHATAPEPQRRRISVLFGLVSRAMRILTPVKMRAQINGCVLCHRHDVDRTICSHHIEDGRYISSSAQRQRFELALSLGIERLKKATLGKEDLLKEIANRELSQQITVEDAKVAFDVLFSSTTNEGLVDLRDLWSQAIDKASSSGTFSVADMAKSWYSLEKVNDTMGVQRIEQPSASLFFKLMSDIARFDCFVASGGELPSQRRKRLHAKEDYDQIKNLRNTGSTLEGIATAMTISVTQVRRILNELNIP